MPKKSDDSTKKIIECKCGKKYKTKTRYEKHLPKCTGIPKPKPKPKTPFSCSYCNKKYVTERGLLNHKCENRLKMEETKKVAGRIGYLCYKYFHNRYAGRTNTSEKTVFDFINSPYYKQFMEFGKFIDDNRIKRYEHYLHYLIQYNVGLENWTNDRIYSIYIRSFMRSETLEAAVEKSFSTMSIWANNNNEKWSDYFRKESKLKIIHHLKMGRISPWVIYNSESGKDFISRLDKADMDEIYEFIDPKFWNSKFERNKDLTQAARTTLQSVGL